MQNRINKQKKVLKIFAACLLLLLVIIIFLRTCHSENEKKSQFKKKAIIVQDSLIAVKDTVPLLLDSVTIDSSKHMVYDSAVNDEKVEANRKKDIPDVVDKVTSLISDSVFKSDTFSDTINQTSVVVAIDSTESQEITSPCTNDTSELWVYPDPSGGLHRSPQAVRFNSNRVCTVQWRMNNSSNWVEYTGGEIQIEKTGTLYFFAVDTCGNRMEIREEYYKIEELQQSKCPDDMEHVEIGETSFCIDTYEWPNKKGVLPVSYISLYQAGDSCFSIGKRLCTADEWRLACSGPYSTKYPYGDRYEKHACTTIDTIIHTSGEKPECRSYFGLFDMSGNLQEWTDTRAVENNRFYYVAGGFWDSGVKSSCSERRYSYYTQNRHNSVGFRCCKDVQTNDNGAKN